MNKRFFKLIISTSFLLILCGGLFSFSFINEKSFSNVYAFDENEEEEEEEMVTSISAVTTHRFYVGDVIRKSDIEVIDNLDNPISDFEFAYDGYQFTYEDAASGGEYTDKIFADSISYNELTCSVTAYVRRATPSTLNNEVESIRYYNLNSSTSYVSFNNVDLGSGFLYTGCISSYNWKHIFINTIYKDRGIVTTGSGGFIKSITLTITNGCNTDVLVYASNTPYTSATNLHYADSQGTLVMRTRSTSTVRLYGEYQYFGIRPDYGAIYIERIDVEYGNPYYALSLCDYIMYEDTVGQCEDIGETKGKYSIAIERFMNELSDSEKDLFMASDYYNFTKARERLSAWARHLGKEIVYEDNIYVVKTLNKFNDVFAGQKIDSTSVIVVLSSSIIAFIGLLTCLIIKKKKQA